MFSIEENKMTFNDYQEKATATDLYPVGNVTEEERVWLAEYRSLCAVGEIGEMLEKVINMLLTSLVTLNLSASGGKLANLAKKIRRDEGAVTEKVRIGIGHEVGDILWYLATLCTIVGLDFEQVAKDNIEMLTSRKKRGKITGAGDNR